MATNLPSCFFNQFLEQLLKFLVNFTLLKYVKSQRSYVFLITKELIFGFQILDLKDHFSASLVLQKIKEDNISQLVDYDASFFEQQYTHGSCYISLFKFKSSDQFNTPKLPQILDIYSVVTL